MRVTIDNRNPDGRGRGLAGRKVALVSQAHPGEEITMRADRTTGGTVQGRVARLISADPNRVPHDCPHEFLCTGCPFLALDPAAERAFKRQRVRQVLAPQLGGDVAVEAVVVPGGPFRYRHFAKQIFARVQRRLVLGSYVTGTHQVVDNRDCPVLVPELARTLAGVADRATRARLRLHGPDQPGLRYAVARQSMSSGRQLLVLVTSEASLLPLRPVAEAVAAAHPAVAGVYGLSNPGEGSVLLAGEGAILWGETSIGDRLLGYEHRIGPRSFFQINPAAAAELFAAALEQAGGGGWCVEGFAGVGALTLPLSEQFSRVTAVESNPEAGAALRATAARHQRADRIEVRVGDARALLPELLARGPDCLVVDPPRAGLGAETTAALAAARVPRVVLVACGLDSLGRDLPPLVAAGYRIRRILPVDQFPRTAHVETVVGLEWPGAGVDPGNQGSRADGGVQSGV